MTSFIACMSAGKGTWTGVYSLIKAKEWENIFIITQEFFKDKLNIGKEHTLILIDNNSSISSIIEQLIVKLKNKLSGDVAVNIISGTGKEHTALLVALFKLGVGIRFVETTNEEVKEIW